MKYFQIYNKIKEFFYYLINFGYNFYYKFRKPILTQKDRYEISRYLNSEDKESRLLGLSLLTNYRTGTDKVSDCSMRITYDYDKPIELRKYFRFGNLRMSETITIQEVINEIKNCLDNNQVPGVFMYERIIGYYFAYHPRIGGQTSQAYAGSIHYPSISGNQKIHINNCEIYTWDWHRSKWAFPVKAKKYWQKHKKPENIYL